jgi:hypothetical protein
MQIYLCCRLGAAVAIRAVEIHCVDAMCAEVHGNAVPPFIGLVV